jgi:hypothetical protein
MLRRGGAVLLVAAAAALCAWPAAGAGDVGAANARTVHIVFTGKGGGRYFDHTRWLHEVTRECYASRLADELLSVQWRIEWTAMLVPGSTGYVLRSPARLGDVIRGSVEGTAVRTAAILRTERLGGDDVGPTSPRTAASRLGRQRVCSSVCAAAPGPASRATDIGMISWRREWLSIRVDQAASVGRSFPAGTRHTARGSSTRRHGAAHTSPHLRQRRPATSDLNDTDLNGAVSVSYAAVISAPPSPGWAGDDARAACASLHIALVSQAKGATRALRRVIAADREAIDALDPGDPLIARFRGGKARAEQALASFSGDPLRSGSMSPTATILPTARRVVEETRSLRSELCR